MDIQLTMLMIEATGWGSNGQAIKSCPIDPSLPDEEQDELYGYFDDDDDLCLDDDCIGFDDG